MRRSTRAWRLSGLIDLVAVAALCVTALAGLRPVWGDFSFMLPCGIALVLGLALAWVGAAFRIRLAPMAALVIVIYLLVGGPLLFSSTTTAGVIPSSETIRDLTRGVVTCWMDFLTATPPLATFSGIAQAPFITTLICATLAGSFALRARPVWALLPALALHAGVVLFGTADAAYPVAQGLGFGIIGLGWCAWRSADRRSPGGDQDSSGWARVRRRRLRNAVVMVALAGLLAGVAGPIAKADHGRTILRQHVTPPLDLHNLTSPLAGFRSYVDKNAKVTMFTVTGLAKGDRIRLATMDSFDGQVYNVAGIDAAKGSGQFRRTGTTVDPDAAHSGAAAKSLTITIGDYQGVWLPTAGKVASLSFTAKDPRSLADGFYYNPATESAITTAGVASGDSYTLKEVPDPTNVASKLTGHAPAKVTLPANSNVPDQVADTAATLVGDASDPVKQAQALASGLSHGGFFSHGLADQTPSSPGHGAGRIAAMLGADQMIGDDEQYAVAMALMARSLGMPARVVLGFYPQDEALGNGPIEIKGEDIHAWVEIDFSSIGWVPFDPTPPKNQVPKTTKPKTAKDPQPQVLQPPPPVQTPDTDAAQSQLDDSKKKAEKKKKDDKKKASAGAGIPRVYVGVIGIPILLIVLVLLVIVLLKVRRRRHRRRAPVPAQRVAGGWREVIDHATDLGTSVPAGGTRRETAEVLNEVYPSAATTVLATQADAGVFAPAEPSQAEVDQFWLMVDHTLGQMNRSVRWTKRLRARLSLKSLRHLKSTSASTDHGSTRKGT